MSSKQSSVRGGCIPGATRINLYESAVMALARAEYAADTRAADEHELQLSIMDSLYGVSSTIKLDALEQAQQVVFGRS